MRRRMLLSIFTPILLAFLTGCIFVGVDRKNSNVEPGIHITTGGSNSGGTANASNLLVIWSSGDREVAMDTCITYLERAVKNKWFNGATLIIWGPSARLLANDKELQARIELIIDMGAKVLASAESASSYGVADKLKELGIDVKPMDASATNVIRASNTRVITF